MSNNRDQIDNGEIVHPAYRVDQGMPLPFLDRQVVVEEGWCKVITEGGAYKETLKPGTHFTMWRYHLLREVRAIPVDTRLKTLRVCTEREFTIKSPVPVELNLDLAVEYRVVDPQRVALEITSPLTSLYDRVIQAVRGAVVHATIDEIRLQGTGIAVTTYQNLMAMQLPKVLGIEIFSVLTTSIKATDVGSDTLAQAEMNKYTKTMEWQVDNQILAQSRITAEWLMVHRPDLYAQLAAGRFEVLKELIDKGLVDPAGFLNQPAGSGALSVQDLLSSMLLPTGVPAGGQPRDAQAQLAAGGTPARDIHARIREELGYLEKIPGVKVDKKFGVDAQGIPDGSHDLRVTFPRPSTGQSMVAYFTCSVAYPAVPPDFSLEIGGDEVPFSSAVLRRWNGQYLVEIIREVRQYYS